jgi:hypothetical protein
MAKVKFSKNLSQMLPAPGQRKRFPALQKVVDDTKVALREAAKAGEEAMKERVLNSPPTGSRSDDGKRVDTWTMYDSISRSRVREGKQRDRRRRTGASVSFGFPADENGNIKDAPMVPTRGPAVPARGQGALPWRSDPNYFAMQEYGDSMFDEAFYPGMFSQRAGLDAAKAAFDSYMKRKGYK